MLRVRVRRPSACASTLASGDAAAAATLLRSHGVDKLAWDELRATLFRDPFQALPASAKPRLTRALGAARHAGAPAAGAE